MTEDELRADYTTVYRSLRAERRWREHVFAEGHLQRAAKLAEIDKLLAVIDRWKDALKPHCEPEPEQPRLLDVPRKGEYL